MPKQQKTKAKVSASPYPAIPPRKYREYLAEFIKEYVLDYNKRKITKDEDDILGEYKIFLKTKHKAQLDSTQEASAKKDIKEIKNLIYAAKWGPGLNNQSSKTAAAVWTECLDVIYGSKNKSKVLNIDSQSIHNLLTEIHNAVKSATDDVKLKKANHGILFLSAIVSDDEHYRSKNTVDISNYSNFSAERGKIRRKFVSGRLNHNNDGYIISDIADEDKGTVTFVSGGDAIGDDTDIKMNEVFSSERVKPGEDGSEYVLSPMSSRNFINDKTGLTSFLATTETSLNRKHLSKNLKTVSKFSGRLASSKETFNTVKKDATSSLSSLYFHSERWLGEALKGNGADIVEKLLTHHNIKAGSKVYALVLDFFSTNTVCVNCQHLLKSLHDNPAIFLNTVANHLKGLGYVISQENGLRLLVRVSAKQEIGTGRATNFPESKEFVIPDRIDVKNFHTAQVFVQKLSQ